jgi:hypothetical protein
VTRRRQPAAVQACGYVPTPRPSLPIYHCERKLVNGTVCGALLHPVPSADRRDWHYADESGSTVHDETPAALTADPKQWWADLAAADMGAYSSHKAAVDLMCFSWWHLHSPGHPAEPHDPGPVPSTCGQPMWSGPDGWVCRVHGEVFPYAD